MIGVLENSFEFKLLQSSQKKIPQETTGIPQLPKLLSVDELRKMFHPCISSLGSESILWRSQSNIMFYLARQRWLGQHLIISSENWKNWGDGNVRYLKIHSGKVRMDIRMDIQKPRIYQLYLWHLFAKDFSRCLFSATSADFDPSNWSAPSLASSSWSPVRFHTTQSPELGKYRFNKQMFLGRLKIVN